MRVSDFSWPVGEEFLRGRAYFIEKLYLKFNHAMLLLQGATMQQLVGPNYLFYAGKKCHPYCPRPHIADVHMASISEAPKGMRLEEAVQLLRACS